MAYPVLSISQISDSLKVSGIAAAVLERLSTGQDAANQWIWVPAEDWATVAQQLLKSELLYLDYLNNLTALDQRSQAEQAMVVVYHLSSVIKKHKVEIRVRALPLPPEGILGAENLLGGEDATLTKNTEVLWEIPSVAQIWQTADWHEREAFDLFGIKFRGHQDLRRILLPADWEGYPLRKDYKPQETYHGLKIKYEKD